MFQPREIRLASGRRLTYIYDSEGGLERVMLPRGGEVSDIVHVYSDNNRFCPQVRLWQRPGQGLTLTGLQWPGQAEAGVTGWDLEGRLAEVRPPGGDGIILYR